ncbi:MAG: hypothetical protein FJ005_09605 [Chloroflexi bacterium]|nr:hypothetical protein [Chloroflexota bacterium]
MKLLKKIKRILGSERGQALPMALILLVLGGFLVIPTLSLTATNLNANRIVEQNTLELYAADAGVADALWQLNNAGLKPYKEWQLPELVNGGTVNVTLSKVNEKLYKIVSIATLPGGSTTVEALVNLGGNPWFFDNAITSANNVIIKPKCVIRGKVVYTNSIDNKGDVIPAPIKDPTVPDRWPNADVVNTFFYNQVRHVQQTSGTRTINISSTSCKEATPCEIPVVNHNGDLTITGGGWARLTGTVYVTGTLTIDSVNLNLNKKTLFAKNAIYVTKNSYIYGAGCVVAWGNVDFKPGSVAATSNDYVFILSVNGTVYAAPNATWNGSVAGYNVEYWPGGTLQWTTPPSDGLDFPSYFTYKQCTYTIK